MLKKKQILMTALSLVITSSIITQAQAAVVTSLKPLGFIAAAITDGVTTTHVLVPDGASGHDYALRPSDVSQIKNAELVVWVGPEMEAFMQKNVGQLPAQRRITLLELEQVKPLLLKDGQHEHEHNHDHEHDHDHPHDHDHSHNHSHEHDHDHQHQGYHHHGTYNLHLWLSPDIALITAQAIHDQLVKHYPQKQQKLNANLQHFQAELARADQQVMQLLAPVRDKGYFVFHQAYDYYEQRYGLTSLGAFTINPEIQPGARRLREIKQQLKANLAECVFAEPQFKPAVIEAVAKGSGARMGTLDPLGGSIAMSQDSYPQFLIRLASEYVSCLQGDTRK